MYDIGKEYQKLFCNKLIQGLLIILLTALITISLTTHPDKRNDRVIALELASEKFPLENPYTEKTPIGYAVDSGMFSIVLAKYINIRVLNIIFWIFVIGLLWNKFDYKSLIDWGLLFFFAFVALRECLYQHEELYWGLPLVYFAYKSENKVFSGVLMGTAMTLRPFYFIFLLPFIFNEWKWISSIFIYLLWFFVFAVLDLNSKPLLYNNIANNIDSNIVWGFNNTGVFMKYSWWILDYILLLVLPMIWFKVPFKRYTQTPEEYLAWKEGRCHEHPELEFSDNYT